MRAGEATAAKSAHLVLLAGVGALVEEQLHGIDEAVERRIVQRGLTLRAGKAAASLRGGCGAGGAAQGGGLRRRPVRGSGCGGGAARGGRRPARRRRNLGHGGRGRDPTDE